MFKDYYLTRVINRAYNALGVMLYFNIATKEQNLCLKLIHKFKFTRPCVC